MRYVNNIKQNNKLATANTLFKNLEIVHSESDDRTETEEHNACVTVRKFVNGARNCTEYILFSHVSSCWAHPAVRRLSWFDSDYRVSEGSNPSLIQLKTELNCARI